MCDFLDFSSPWKHYNVHIEFFSLLAVGEGPGLGLLMIVLLIKLTKTYIILPLPYQNEIVAQLFVLPSKWGFRQTIAKDTRILDNLNFLQPC